MGAAKGWLLGIGVTLVVELFLIWRIARALNRGTIKIDPLFWLADTMGFDFTVSRATHPIMYWLGVLSVMLFAIAVLAIFVFAAAMNLR
jgi:hypothetical protein